MSFKVYEGLKATYDDADVLELTKSVVDVACTCFDDVKAVLVAKRMARIVDRSHERRSVDGFVLRTAEQRWLDENNGMRESDPLHDPLRFSIVFGRASSGALLANIYALESLYRERLLQSGLFVDYHYQDQTDRPESVSEKEWSERKNDWNSVLDEYDSMSSLCGWTLPRSIANAFDRFNGYDKIRGIDLNQVWTPADRLKEVIVDLLTDRIATAHGTIDNIGNVVDARFTAIRKVNAWMADDESNSVVFEPDPIFIGLEASELSAPLDESIPRDVLADIDRLYQ